MFLNSECCHRRSESLDAVTDLSTEDFDSILQAEAVERNLELLYRACVYTVLNYFGKESAKYPASPQDLLAYVNTNITLNYFVRKTLLISTKDIKTPSYLIILKVEAAESLESTDPNGLSDPYCLVWSSEATKLKHKTIVVEDTLDPVWQDQVFTLKIKNGKQGVLLMHVFDHDPEGVIEAMREARNVRGMQGCLSLVKDTLETSKCCGSASADDFLGEACLDVSDIPCDGINEWLQLRTKNQTPIQGRLKIAATFDVVNEENHENRSKRHLLLVRYFMQIELNAQRRKRKSLCKIETILPSSARTLIFQHAVQSGITPCENLMSLWLTSYLTTEDYPMSYEYNYVLLNEIRELFLILEKDRFSGEFSHAFLQSLALFNIDCGNFVENFSTPLELIEERQFAMKCIFICHSFLNVETGIYGPLTTTAVSWCENIVREFLVQVNLETDSRVSYVTDVLEALNLFVKNTECMDLGNLKFMRSVMKETWQLTTSYVKPFVLDAIRNVKKGKEYDQAINDAAKILRLSSNLWRKVEQFCARFVTDVDSYGTWLEDSDVENFINWFKHREEVVLGEFKTLQFSDVGKGAYIKDISPSVARYIYLIHSQIFCLWENISCPREKVNLSFLAFMGSCCSILCVMLQATVVGSKTQCDDLNASAANNVWHVLTYFRKILNENKKVLIPIPNFEIELQKMCQKIYLPIIKDAQKHIKQTVTSVSNLGLNAGRREIEALVAFLANLIWKYLCELLVNGVLSLAVHDLWNCLEECVGSYAKFYRDEKAQKNRVVAMLYCLCPNTQIKKNLRSLLEDAKSLMFKANVLPLSDEETRRYQMTVRDLEDIAKVGTT